MTMCFEKANGFNEVLAGAKNRQTIDQALNRVMPGDHASDLIHI